ncbi:MAG: sigma factor [Planctomycetota bacterium]
MSTATIERPTVPASNPTADWIDQYALDRVGYQVSRIGRDLGLNRHDQEEVRQELLMDLWVAAPKYDPEIASRRTFVSGVVARSALRVRRQLSRSPGRRASDPVLLSDLQRRERDRLTPARDHTEQSDVAMDVASALDALEHGKRELAHELMRSTVTEAAREIGCDRSTAYRAVAAMRTELDSLKTLITP